MHEQGSPHIALALDLVFDVLDSPFGLNSRGSIRSRPKSREIRPMLRTSSWLYPKITWAFGQTNVKPPSSSVMKTASDMFNQRDSVQLLRLAKGLRRDRFFHSVTPWKSPRGLLIGGRVNSGRTDQDRLRIDQSLRSAYKF
jgi:hypothetical protein